MERFKGQVAIITGSGQGIGKGIAKRLAREGAIVVIADTPTGEVVSAVREVEHELVATPSDEYVPHYMFRNMRKKGFPGIAICSCSDRFNEREGRIRAKRHLISHLMHQPHIIVTLDKHRALYPINTIKDVPEKQVYAMDDVAAARHERIRVHKSRAKLDKLSGTEEALKKRLADQADRIVAMKRTIIASRKTIEDRDTLIWEQGEIIQQLRATRSVHLKEPETTVRVRDPHTYITGTFGVRTIRTVSPEDPISVGGTDK